MISKPDSTTYAYDAMDRLIDVDLPDTTHIDYVYDWDGRRIQKDVDSGTEVVNYLWDEFSIYGDVILETDDTNAVLGNYALANGQLISQTRSSVDRFYLADGQGSIRALVDDAGTVNVTDNYTYKAFGETLISNETTENLYQYTGQQYDELTGLYSLRARYYNPNAGRFLTRDKLSCLLCDPIELNRYVYVANNPTNLLDPSGHQAIPGYLGPTTSQGISTAVFAKTVGKILAIVIVDTLICFLVGVCTLDNNRNSTCQQDFPHLRRCNQLPYDYQFRTPQGALNAMKATLGEKSLRLASPNATISGPCPREGLHYNVRGKGGSSYPGSIVCCPCCDDTGGKARQVQRCRIVY